MAKRIGPAFKFGEYIRTCSDDMLQHLKDLAVMEQKRREGVKGAKPVAKKKGRPKKPAPVAVEPVSVAS